MTTWERRDDWIGTQVEDHYVMINLDSGRYIGLNATATEAWHALEEAKDSDALAGALIEKFRIDPEECGQAVEMLLSRMAELDLVRRID